MHENSQYIQSFPTIYIKGVRPGLNKYSKNVCIEMCGHTEMVYITKVIGGIHWLC